MVLNKVESLQLGRWIADAPNDVLKVSAAARALKQTRGLNDADVSELRESLVRSRLTSRLERRFLGILEQDAFIRERAALDYCRLHLARAIGSALTGLTPRYRNEAARNNFLKQLASVCRGIHLSSADVAVGHFAELQTGDPLNETVKQNFQRSLLEPRSLSQDFKQKTQRLNAEMDALLDAAEELTGSDRRTSERYVPNLGVTSFFDPSVLEDERVFNWGANYDRSSGSLILNPSIVLIPALRHGVLGREAVLLLTPPVMERVDTAAGSRAMFEQAEYLAYKIMDSKAEKQFWFHARHGLRRGTLIRADELLDFFQYYEMLVGPNLYRELWARLREMHQANLTLADYRIIFHTLASRPTKPKFEPKELQLLSLLVRQPDISPGNAARAMKTSIPTAAKMISDVTLKASLLFTALIDVPSLGLREFLFQLRAANYGETTRVLARIPFCRQLYRTYGSADLFGVIDVPPAHSSFVDELFSAMRSKGLISEALVAEARASHQSVNFDAFDLESGAWNLHWDTLGVSLRDELRKAAQSTDNLEGLAPEKFKVEMIDFRIMDALNADCRKPFADIARSLGVSGAYVGQRIRRMRAQSVYRPAVWPLKTGAEDLGLLWIECEQKIAQSLVGFLGGMPSWRGSSVNGALSGLVALVWIPNGELKQFFKLIDDRVVREGFSKRCTFQSVGEWLLGRWLPVGPHPHQLLKEDGTWEFDRSKYISLIR
jgi:DNA-binding MarR family transcriptional regulator